MVERPRHRPATTSDDDEHSSHHSNAEISWDELGDAINLGRRQSMSSASAGARTAATLRSEGALPTIYASGKSTKDFDYQFSSSDEEGGNSPRRHHSEHISPRRNHDDGNYATMSSAAGHQSCSWPAANNNLGDEDGDYNNGNDEPIQRRNNRHTLPTKLNHSLRNSDTSWDDLQDEIAKAMKQSMMVSNGHTTGAATEKEKNSSKNGQQQQQAAGGAWNCPACTFLNENPLHLVCAICGTAKVASSEGGPSLPPANSSTSPNNNHNHRSASFSSSFSSLPGNNRGKQRSRHGSFNEDSNLQNSFSSLHSHSSRVSHRRSSSMRGGGGYPGDELLRSSSGSQHHKRGFSEPNNDIDYLRHSTNSRGSTRNNRRSGVRRSTVSGEPSHRRSDNSIRNVGHLRRSSSEHSPMNDSFGSFNSQDYQLSFLKSKSQHERGGGMSSRDNARRGGEDRKMHKSMSHASGGASVSSHRSHRSHRSSSHNRRASTDSSSHNRRADSMSRRSRRSTIGSSSHRSSKMRPENHRSRSDFNCSYGHGNDFEYDSADSYGGKQQTDHVILDTESNDCSDLSEEMYEDEDTIYRDDKTARTMRTVKTLRVPEGEVTIIYTDVQGSTSLWEADPLAMKKATDLHDSIIRKCYADHGGYEITTEGDAFNLAFQHPADAIGFALKAQLSLYRAKWPEGILNHPDGCDNEKKKFRGFRVRMGMHHGPTTSTVHDTTGRTIYQGEAVNISKAIEKMSHGGQILTTVETWRTVSGMAEQFLGSPQVMDCGEHLLYDPKKVESSSKSSKKKRIFSKRIVQLVPNSLSYDFFAARGGQEVKEGEQPERVCGRVFPPLLSHGQLSTSFLNAPYNGNRVAMVFVYTDKMEAVSDKERKKNYKILAKYVRSHLMRLSPPGYECQEDKGSWMLAFDRIENGIKFGLDLKEDVINNSNLFGEVDVERAFRIGIHWGPFLSMGPHTVSGHADYFGPIVNRAARVAAQCEPGQVCVGVPMGDGEEPPDPGPSVDVDVLGVKQLKGISIEMAIFACKKRKGKSSKS